MYGKLNLNKGGFTGKLKLHFKGNRPFERIQDVSVNFERDNFTLVIGPSSRINRGKRISEKEQ